MQKFLSEIINHYPIKRREYLMPILQEVMQKHGYINVDTIIELSDYFNLPTVKIYSVASYFDQFSFEPSGCHSIAICSGTACHLQKSEELYDELIEYLNLKNKTTTDDGLFTIRKVNCLGACSEGLIVKMDDVFYTHAELEILKNRIDEIRQSGE